MSSGSPSSCKKWGVGAALSAFADWAGLYWLAAVPIGLGWTAWLHVRSQDRAVVRRKASPYRVIGAAMSAGGFASGFLFPADVTVVAVWVVMGLGLAGLTWLERLRPASVLFVGLAALSAVLRAMTGDRFALYPVLGVTFGVALAALAAGIRTTRP
jgi:hypothetical protein